MSLFAELKRRNVIRVGVAYIAASWLLIEASSLILDIYRAPDWASQVVVAMLAMGFPISLFFAWAFEVTPEGLKREHEVDRTQSITPQTAKRLDILTIVIVIAAVMLLSLDRFILQPGQVIAPGPVVSEVAPVVTQPTDLSIAVLPFVNMSADAENEYFSDGIAEELLNLLAKIKTLKVAARTASFHYKGHTGNVAEIGRELRVATILEGSVRKSGNRVRITAQLVNVADGYHLWSDTYDRELEDIFAVQDEIAKSIVAALAQSLGIKKPVAPVRDRVPTNSIEAYQLYLKGRHIWYQRSDHNMIREVIELLGQAVKLDPDFGQAQAALASAYAVLPSWVSQPDPDDIDRAVQAARRAIELRPDLAEPHAVLGAVAMERRDFIGSEAHLIRAIELDSDYATAHQWLAELLVRVGKLPQAAQSALRAHRLHPTSPITANWVGFTAWSVADYELAREYNELSVALGWTWGHWVLGVLYAQNGEYEKSRASFARAPEAFVGSGAWIDGYLRAVQYGEQLDPVVADLKSKFTGQADYGLATSVYLNVLNRPEDALDVLTTVAQIHATANALVFFWQPEGKAMRQLPRFRALLKDQGVVDYWIQNGWPEICRPIGEDEFECD